jgi:hypothetical protein
VGGFVFFKGLEQVQDEVWPLGCVCGGEGGVFEELQDFRVAVRFDAVVHVLGGEVNIAANLVFDGLFAGWGLQWGCGGGTFNKLAINPDRFPR